jgi:hypothetical protein
MPGDNARNRRRFIAGHADPPGCLILRSWRREIVAFRHALASAGRRFVTWLSRNLPQFAAT